MMEAAVSKSASLLETQIDMILHVRSAWQKLDIGRRGTSNVDRNPYRATTAPSAPRSDTVLERIPFSHPADLESPGQVKRRKPACSALLPSAWSSDCRASSKYITLQMSLEVPFEIGSVVLRRPRRK